MAIKRRIETKDAIIEYNITLDDVLNNTSKRTLQQELTKVIDSQILPTLEKGLSPVAGERVLKRYSEGYKNSIKSGRYSQYGKNPSPATLKLSGNMLSFYTAKTDDSKPNTATIGIHKDADKEVIELAGYHQKGTDKMPARPFIPDEDRNQRFTAKIERAIRAAFSLVLSNALRDQLNKGRNKS
jgi:hypothetical protein